MTERTPVTGQPLVAAAAATPWAAARARLATPERNRTYWPATVFGLPGIAGTEQGEGSAGAFSSTRWRF